jgi:protein-disulfide isomerase
MSSGVEDDQEDLTRKQRREQARGERKALEQAQAARAARRTRLTQLGIVVAVVVVVIVGIVIATGGSSNKKTVIAGSHESNATVKEIKTLIGGIPQSGNTLGDPNAPLTLKYFGDLECPICRDFTLQILPTLIPKYVRTGKLKIEYHSLETATRESSIFKTQQIAAYAAGKQNLGWYFIETFYHEQLPEEQEDAGAVTESYIQNIASQVPGLNLADWTAARGEPAYANEVAADAQAASNEGFSGTPSFQLGKTGGTLPKFEPGTYSETAPYEAAIEKLLKS